jgi:hypothetical protein
MLRLLRFALIVPLFFLALLVHIPGAVAVTDVSPVTEEMMDGYCKVHGNRGVVLLPGGTAYDSV